MPKSKPFSRKVFVQGPEHFSQCAQCDKMYRNKLGVRLHDKVCPFFNQLSINQLNEKSYECLCCGIEFNNQIQIKEHILKKHNGDWKVATRRA